MNSKRRVTYNDWSNGRVESCADGIWPEKSFRFSNNTFSWDNWAKFGDSGPESAFPHKLNTCSFPREYSESGIWPVNRFRGIESSLSDVSSEIPAGMLPDRDWL